MLQLVSMPSKNNVSPVIFLKARTIGFLTRRTDQEIYHLSSPGIQYPWNRKGLSALDRRS